MEHSNGWARAREEVLLYCHRMQAEHLTSFTAGNISKRVDDEPELVAMTPEDICIVTIDGKIVDGRRGPTSEFPLHTLVYARRQEVGAIVHTHSPAALAMAANGMTLPPFLTGLVAAVGGGVVAAPYSRPGTPELADYTQEALFDRGACFLRFHGVLAVGATLAHAYNAASAVEAAADAYLRALALGPVPELPVDEVAWIADAWRSQWAGSARIV
jgi:L-fuculose-phosphate aldolase